MNTSSVGKASRRTRSRSEPIAGERKAEIRQTPVDATTDGWPSAGCSATETLKCCRVKNSASRDWGDKIDAVQYALRHAPAVYDRTAGIVLNKVDVDAMGRYDTYGGMYYGYSYGSVPNTPHATGRAELSA